MCTGKLVTTSTQTYSVRYKIEDRGNSDMPLDVFETDWQRQWLVERGVEIVSEASRRLPDELKARHPEIPWQKVAGIGNVLRHDYESIAAPVMWKLAQADLPALEKVLPRRTGGRAYTRKRLLIA
jgi:uncharacterized protein with HEPN domain